MLSVGKVLILPKGRYDADAVYQTLDLVMHNGTSWIAKKTVVGIEPSEENAEYWQKLVDIDDAIDHEIEEFFGSGDSSLSLTTPSLTLYNSNNSEARGTLDVDSTGALLYGGNAILHTLNLDTLLSEYLKNYMAKYLVENSFSQNKIVSYVGTGLYGIDNPCSITLPFVPRILKFMASEYTSYTGEKSFQRGYDHSVSSTNNLGLMDVIVCDSLPTEFDENFHVGLADDSSNHAATHGKKSEDGKTITWYSDSAEHQCNVENQTYYFMAIG